MVARALSQVEFTTSYLLVGDLGELVDLFFAIESYSIIQSTSTQRGADSRTQLSVSTCCSQTNYCQLTISRQLSQPSHGSIRKVECILTSGCGISYVLPSSLSSRLVTAVSTSGMSRPAVDEIDQIDHLDDLDRLDHLYAKVRL